MAEYRAYTVGSDGHFVGFEPLNYDCDDDAISKACSLLDGHDVEVWSGPRFVTRLHAKKSPDAVTHEIKDRRLTPKT
jgi:hypothetical protein